MDVDPTELLSKLVDAEYVQLFELAGLTFYLTKNTVLMIVMFLILIAIVCLVGSMYKNKEEKIPTGFWMNFIESFVLYVRDKMVYPIMGEKKGRLYLPFFLTLFLFLLISNVLGKIPTVYFPGAGMIYPGGAPTADPFILGGLAALVFAVGIGGGIYEHGIIGYLKNYVPHGVPWPLAILLWPIEVLGMIIKHAVLAIRLLGNLNGGNAALYGILFGVVILVDFFGIWGWIGGLFGKIPLAVFLTMIKLMVVVIHAYIFTILSILFMDMQISGH